MEEGYLPEPHEIPCDVYESLTAVSEFLFLQVYPSLPTEAFSYLAVPIAVGRVFLYSAHVPPNNAEYEAELPADIR